MISNKGTLDVSVVVCTLNEEKNIKDCIEHIKQNNPKEIIVIDANSSDKTKEITKECNVRLITTKRNGLAYQRQIGVEKANGDFILFVDADDRLSGNCIAVLKKELLENNYDAIQAMTLSYEPKTYAQQAMDFNLKHFISRPGVTNMVGRPALYRTSVFNSIQFDSQFKFGSEDTDLSAQLELAGFKQGIGLGVSKRIHLETFRDCIKQWVRYGKGDAAFVRKYPDKFTGMLFHLLINYPIKKSLKCFIKLKVQFIPFFIVQGYVRFFTLILALKTRNENL